MLFVKLLTLLSPTLDFPRGMTKNKWPPNSCSMNCVVSIKLDFFLVFLLLHKLLLWNMFLSYPYRTPQWWQKKDRFDFLLCCLMKTIFFFSYQQMLLLIKKLFHPSNIQLLACFNEYSNTMKTQSWVFFEWCVFSFESLYLSMFFMCYLVKQPVQGV